MSRYQSMFARLESAREAALVPFLVVGDPDPDTSLALIRTLARHGADALELGLPFSDPIADGPVIQAAAGRALARGATLSVGWEILTTIRAEFPELPIGLLVYSNLVLGRDPDAFFGSAAWSGVDSVLVADLPLLEAEPVRQVAKRHGIGSVLVAPPNADETRLGAIAAKSEGYVYVTSRPGVTGADQALQRDARRVIEALRAAGSAPPLLGFGIAAPQHVRDAKALGAAGAISGSAVVRRVADNLEDRHRMLDAVAGFVAGMKDATRA